MTHAVGPGTALGIPHQHIAGTGPLGNSAKPSYAQHLTHDRLLLVGVGAPVNEARVGAAVDLGAHTTRSGHPAAQPSGLAYCLDATERVLRHYLRVGVERTSEVLNKQQIDCRLKAKERKKCERQTESFKTIDVFGPYLCLPFLPYQIITNLVVSKTTRLSSSGLVGQKCIVGLTGLKSRCQTVFLRGEAEGESLCPCVLAVQFLAAAGLGAPFLCGCQPRAIGVCWRPLASSRALGSSGSFRPVFCRP